MENYKAHTDLINLHIIVAVGFVIIGFVSAVVIFINDSDLWTKIFLIAWIILAISQTIKYSLSISDIIVTGNKIRIVNKLNDDDEIYFKDISEIYLENLVLIIQTKSKKYYGYFEKDEGKSLVNELESSKLFYCKS